MTSVATSVNSKVGFVVVLLIGCYGLAEALSIGLSDSQRLLYAIVAAGIGLALCKDRLFSRKAKQSAVVKMIALVSLFILPSLFNEELQLRYFAVDYVSLLLPVLLFGILQGDSWMVRSREALYVIGIFALVASFVGMVVGGMDASRFVPPSLLLVSILSVAVFGSQNVGAKVACLFLLLLLAYITIQSGQRSTILLIPIGLTLALVICVKQLKLLVVLTLILLGTLFLISLYHDWIFAFLDQSRFGAFLSFELDVSTRTRFVEAEDAFYNMRSKGNVLNYFIGFGHGATFESYGGVNYKNYIDGNSGVHHIHMGPVLFFYRYGIVGLTIYLSLWLMSAYVLYRFRRMKRTPFVGIVLVIACLLNLVNGLVRNVFVDPEMSFCIAAVFFYISALRRQQKQ